MIKYLVLFMGVVDLVIAAGGGYAWSRKGDVAPAYSLAVAAPLAQKAVAFGPNEMNRLQAWLSADIDQALAARTAKGLAPISLTLVLEDVRPSRPLGLIVQTGAPARRGGATISGALTGVNGRTTPLFYRAYGRGMSTGAAPETWADARAAFQVFANMVAQDRFGRCAQAGSGCKLNTALPRPPEGLRRAV